MAVFLTRSECRVGTWHVVTYDVSDPDNWIEIEDIPTQQPCNEIPLTISLTRLSDKDARKLNLLKKKKKNNKKSSKRKS